MSDQVEQAMLNGLFPQPILRREVLRKVGATRYLSGLGARGYMQPDLFEAAGIEIEWQHFVHPVYPQPFGEFIPYLSILDTLLNCGIAGTRDLLWSCK